MSSSHFVGIDWAGDGWLAVVFSSQGYKEVRTEPNIEDIWEMYQPNSKFVIDIPIGLCSSIEDPEDGCEEDEDGLYRECDSLAREVVGWPRSSSVFTPPARKVATDIVENLDTGESNGTDFSQQNEELTRKGLTQQATNIAPQIMEVDNLLSERDDLEAINEGHPEVCFRAFNDSKLDHSKHSALGLDERLTALCNVPEYEQGMWREIATDLHQEEGNPGIDDLIDAIALALTAVGHDNWFFLPPGLPTDSEDRPMRIVYRSNEPLEEVQELYPE